MPLSYLTDPSGRNTAVVIPIGEWKVLVKKHDDLHELEAKNEVKTKSRISKYKGALSAKAGEALNKHVDQSCREWDRNV
jgi:hypothetical protein